MAVRWCRYDRLGICGLVPHRDAIGKKVEMALLTGVLEVGAAYDVGLRLRVILAEGDTGGCGPVDQPQDRRGGCRAVG